MLEIDESFGWSLAISQAHLVPVVVRLHGPWFLNGRFEGHSLANTSDVSRQGHEGRGIANAQFATAPSVEVLQSVKSHYGYPLPASRVIPNPFAAVTEAWTWGQATCKPDWLLFVGQSDEQKGGDLVLQAFAALGPSYPNVHLTFVGPDRGIRGKDGKTWTIDQFIRSVVPEQYRERIEFRGQMEHALIVAERRAHFATIIASRYETARYTALEAMSLGCPIVATAVGGIPELTKNEHNGLLAPPDATAIAEALRRLLNDPSFAIRFGRQAWLDCRNLCSPGDIARQTVATYE